jgi:hypothetical protein
MAADVSTGEVPRCPWCSAPLATPPAELCVDCGAVLGGAAGSEPQLPGVTMLDAEAILRAKSAVSRPRSGLISFLVGNVPDTGDATAQPPGPGSLAPPSGDVRREMIRLELAARLAELEAEAAELGAIVEEAHPADPTAPAPGAQAAEDGREAESSPGAG